MKQEELCRKLTEMIAETKAEKLSWRLEVQTTEGNDAYEKPVEEEHGTKWTIDECYASYSCNYRGKEFCMITYELLKKSGDKERSSNPLFRSSHLTAVQCGDVGGACGPHSPALAAFDGALQREAARCGACGKTRDAYDRRGKPVDRDSLHYTKNVRETAVCAASRTFFSAGIFRLHLKRGRSGFLKQRILNPQIPLSPSECRSRNFF